MAKDAVKPPLLKRLREDRAFQLAAALCLIGILVRVVGFDRLPAGLNVDEAFSGYEAYSLMQYGVDSSGYKNPVYLATWGSGMNALETYLIMPFMAVLGCTVTAVRLPQLILACITLPVFYLTLKKLFSVRTALVGLALLAISPWHIMLSRWGLETNLAAAFLLFGFYFLLKGREQPGFWLLSAVMYGLSLYTHAVVWMVVPVTLVGFFVYFIYTRQRMPVGPLVAAGVILFLFALPLLLFVLINKGFLPEIRTSFFSIPKLIVFRSGDISLRNFIDPYQLLLSGKQILGLGDSLIFDTVRPFGMYYLFSVPFILFGYGCLAVSALKSLRSRQFDPATLVLIGTAVSALVTILISYVNVARSKCLHLWTIMVLALGLRAFLQLLKDRKWLRNTLITAYAVSFVIFTGYYFTSYGKDAVSAFRPGIGEGIACLKEQQISGDVLLDRDIPHANVLFYDQTPSPVYLDTVVYREMVTECLEAKQFEGYVFADGTVQPGDAAACIVKKEQADAFAQQGYETRVYGEYCAAWLPEETSG